MGFFSKLLGSKNEALPEALPENAVLIDVRSPAEYATGHIRGAVLLPLNTVALSIDRVVPEKAAPIVVYCQSGARSSSARQQLLDMGYSNVINGGGLNALAGRLNRDIVR